MSKNAKKSLIPSSSNTQRFNSKQYERPGFTEEEILEIKEAFDIFDADG